MMKRIIPVLLALAFLTSGFSVRPAERVLNSSPTEDEVSEPLDETALGQLPVLTVTDGTTSVVYTLAEANYEYQSAFMRFYQNYGAYGVIDGSIPLDQQICPFMSDGSTWHDFFKNYAQSSLIERTAVYAAAVENGYTELTEEEQGQIDSVMDSYAYYAYVYGYGSTDEFLAYYYGLGNTEETLRRYQREQLLATRYLQDVYDSLTYSEEELDAYYTENADGWDQVYCLLATFPEEISDDTTHALEKASAIATASRNDEEAFRRLVMEEIGEAPAEIHDTVDTFMQTFSGDVEREDIQAGYSFISQYGEQVTVGFVQRIEDNRYSTVNVRHILVMAEDSDGDGVYSEEEKQAALDALKTIEEEWLNGEASEESFAALAAEKSDDPGSVATGGLYEDIYKGQMVQGFNDFCFAGHEKGDTGIVYGESGAYSGYHLIYFVGETGKLRGWQMAEDALRSRDYNDFFDAVVEPYTAEQTPEWDYVMSR